MSVQLYADKAKRLAKEIGQQALSSLYPNDFEWYMVALELTDSNDNTIDYLTFPITPDSITKSEPTRTNIKKSMSGVTVLTNPSFTPQEINIKGSFGRLFKILVDKSFDVGSVAFSTKAGKFGLNSIANGGKHVASISFNQFTTGVKTGYGVIKLLQAITSKSVGLGENGKPLRLYFYNMALGESYLVVIPPSGVQFSQDLSKNMIWNYNLTMIAVAPIEAVTPKNAKELTDSLMPSMIQTGVSYVAGIVNDALKPAKTKILEKWL